MNKKLSLVSAAVALAAMFLLVGFLGFGHAPVANAEGAASAWPEECRGLQEIPGWNVYVVASTPMSIAAQGQPAGVISVTTAGLEFQICLAEYAYPDGGQFWPAGGMDGVIGHYDVPAGELVTLTIPHQGVHLEGELWSLGGYNPPAPTATPTNTPSATPTVVPQTLSLTDLGLFVQYPHTPITATLAGWTGNGYTRTVSFDTPLIGGDGEIHGYYGNEIVDDLPYVERMVVHSNMTLLIGNVSGNWSVEGQSFVQTPSVTATPTNTLAPTATPSPAATSTPVANPVDLQVLSVNWIPGVSAQTIITSSTGYSESFHAIAQVSQDGGTWYEHDSSWFAEIAASEPITWNLPVPNVTFTQLRVIVDDNETVTETNEANHSFMAVNDPAMGTVVGPAVVFATVEHAVFTVEVTGVNIMTATYVWQVSGDAHRPLGCVAAKVAAPNAICVNWPKEGIGAQTVQVWVTDQNTTYFLSTVVEVKDPSNRYQIFLPFVGKNWYPGDDLEVKMEPVTACPSNLVQVQNWTRGVFGDQSMKEALTENLGQIRNPNAPAGTYAFSVCIQSDLMPRGMNMVPNDNWGAVVVLPPLMVATVTMAPGVATMNFVVTQ